MYRLSSRRGVLGHERLVVKVFKTAQSMHDFQNAQFDNYWSQEFRPLKAGIHAMVGGEWKNIKDIPTHVLNHV
jgi:hypothetical protein